MIAVSNPTLWRELLPVDALPDKAGGCAANVAIDLTKQGTAVDVAGCLGEDSSARVLLASDEALLLSGLRTPQDQLRFFLEQEANTVLITLGKRGVLAGRGIVPVDVPSICVAAALTYIRC